MFLLEVIGKAASPMPHPIETERLQAAVFHNGVGGSAGRRLMKLRSCRLEARVQSTQPEDAFCKFVPGTAAFGAAMEEPKAIRFQQYLHLFGPGPAVGVGVTT